MTATQRPASNSEARKRTLAALVDGAVLTTDLLSEALHRAAAAVEEVNRANGWFDDGRTFGDDIALLHSEVSEGLEAYRDHGLVDVTGDLCTTDPDGTHLHTGPCKPEGVGSELADVFIRLLDTCTRRGINLAEEFERKVEFNATRGHRHGGKRL